MTVHIFILAHIYVGVDRIIYNIAGRISMHSLYVAIRTSCGSRTEAHELKAATLTREILPH